VDKSPAFHRHAAQADGGGAAPNDKKREETLLYYTKQLSLKEKLMRELHWRFGHVSAPTIRRIVKMNLVNGMKIKPEDLPKEMPPCYHCRCGKMRARNHDKEIVRDTVIGRTWSTDGMGPFRVADSKGNLYIRTFIEDVTNYKVVFVYKSQETWQFLNHIRELQSSVLTPNGYTLGRIRTDRQKAFTSKNATRFAWRHKFDFDYVPTDASQANGIAESSNLHTMNSLRAMLCGVTKQLWGHAAKYAGVLSNCVPHRGRSWTATPHEQFHGRKPSFSKLYPFGCHLVWQYPKDMKDKQELRGRQGIYTWDRATTDAGIWCGI
jgi:hypothetical protein